MASRYWRLVRLTAAGKCITEEIVQAREFFRQQFPELAGQVEVQDSFIQRQLLQLIRGTLKDSCFDASSRPLAECCLRCFISSQIQQACIRLEAQFGREHGFTRYDLLSFVLNDDGVVRLQASGGSQFSSYQSLATKILQTFDPDKSGLAAWTARLVQHHRELNACLLEHGVYLVSDWAILNDTNSKQLQRILSDFHHLTPHEIQTAGALLECYHTVYRCDRLKQRRVGNKGACQPPTITQLSRIAHCFRSKTNQTLSPEDVLARLQDLAGHLRHYRISVRRRSPPTEPIVEMPESRLPPDNAIEPDDQTEFLRRYRQQFIQCLDQAIKQVKAARLTHLHQRAESFIFALQLYYCQRRSMSQIAPQIGLQHQYQVTRLLKLKEFRADVRQRMLELLRACIVDIAKNYVHPDRLRHLDNQMEGVLEEQIKAVITDAEANTPKSYPSISLFAQRLCRNLLPDTAAEGQV